MGTPTTFKTPIFHHVCLPLRPCLCHRCSLVYTQVFCVTGSNAHEEMRTACFDYLSQGGPCSSGPVSLLSGLNPSPSLLVMHFFSVALFGVQRLLRPRPTFRCV